MRGVGSQASESELSNQVYVTVGWSHTLLPFSGKSNKLEVVVPRSGTVLSADVWTVPSASQADFGVLDRWYEYTTGSEQGAQGLKRGCADIVLLKRLEEEGAAGEGEGGAAAMAAAGRGADVLTAVNNYTPSPSTIRNSAFLLPWTEDTTVQFKGLAL